MAISIMAQLEKTQNVPLNKRVKVLTPRTVHSMDKVSAWQITHVHGKCEIMFLMAIKL
jgi:hypothetical protein